MVVGLPRALLYYRYGTQWRVFLETLGCTVAVSGPTDARLFARGARAAIDENCAPVKIFLGHVESLIGHCDAILIPRVTRLGRRDELCACFFGLPDVVRNTFPDAPLVFCNVEGDPRRAYLRLAAALGKRRGAARACRIAEEARRRGDAARSREQDRLFREAPGPRVLIAAQSYVIGDDFLGGAVTRLVREQGGTPLLTAACDRGACRPLADALTPGLHWSVSREHVGAIVRHGPQADGVLMVAAFPCGTDALVGEMVARRLRGVPLARLTLDGQHGGEGLRTRVESFMDRLKERASHG